MSAFCEHLGSDWLTSGMLDARQEAERDLDAEELEEELTRQQPTWQHPLMIGEGGRAAVVSEAV